MDISIHISPPEDPNPNKGLQDQTEGPQDGYQERTAAGSTAHWWTCATDEKGLQVENLKCRKV